MRVLAYVYDSANAPEYVEAVLDRLDEREEEIEVLDVASVENRSDAIREATLTVKEGVGIGTTPDDLFDEAGNPDFSAGALITEAETGRRSLYVGQEALAVLDD